MLELRLNLIHEGDETFLVTTAHNPGAKPATMVAHPRYYLFELQNEFGQFIRPSKSDAADNELPKRTHYLNVAPSATIELLRLRLDRTRSEELILGPGHYPNPPPLAKARVTYKAADRIMPNLPRDAQKSFFAGPADAISEPLTPKK